MKKRCLLCGKKFQSEAELRDHYINFHKVDSSNNFFKKLFHECTTNRTLNKNFSLCGEFLTDLNYKKSYDFVRHYEKGKKTLVEDKPSEILNTANITKYQISYAKHSEDYDFTNSEQVVNEFLTNVKLHFKPGGRVQIKGSFATENYQPSVSEEYPVLYNTRYWSTSVYSATYFNSYVYYSLRQDIGKRVILKGLSGSSWLFNKFTNLSVSIYKNPSKLLL